MLHNANVFTPKITLQIIPMGSTSPDWRKYLRNLYYIIFSISPQS